MDSCWLFSPFFCLGLKPAALIAQNIWQAFHNHHHQQRKRNYYVLVIPIHQQKQKRNNNSAHVTPRKWITGAHITSTVPPTHSHDIIVICPIGTHYPRWHRMVDDSTRVDSRKEYNSPSAETGDWRWAQGGWGFWFARLLCANLHCCSLLTWLMLAGGGW